MSLRITAPSPHGRRRRGPGGEEITEEGDVYMSRLIKLIPAEAVAVYPLLDGRAHEVAHAVRSSAADAAAKATAANTPTTTPTTGLTTDVIGTVAPTITRAAETASEVATTHWLPISVAWVVLLLVILIRWHATRSPGGDAQWGAVAIAAISFFLWVPAIGGTFGVMEMATGLEWITWHVEIQKFIPETLLLFWTILIPVFYQPKA